MFLNRLIHSVTDACVIGLPQGLDPAATRGLLLCRHATLRPIEPGVELRTKTSAWKTYWGEGVDTI